MYSIKFCHSCHPETSTSIEWRCIDDCKSQQIKLYNYDDLSQTLNTSSKEHIMFLMHIVVSREYPQIDHSLPKVWLLGYQSTPILLQIYMLKCVILYLCKVTHHLTYMYVGYNRIANAIHTCKLHVIGELTHAWWECAIIRQVDSMDIGCHVAIGCHC